MISLALISSLAGPDGLIIFAVILLLFGAKKLPELARGLGSAVREFSKAKDEIEHEITRPAPVDRRIEPPKETHSYAGTTTDDEYHQEYAKSDEEYHRRQAEQEEKERLERERATRTASAVPPPTSPTTPI